MIRFALALLLAAQSACPALAGDFSVLVRTPAGQPVADAVVALYPAGGAGSASERLKGPFAVSQHDLSFDPFVIVAPVGVEVGFPNKDPVRHHVYSFSPAKRFELKLYGKQEERTVTFDKPGVVALGCNIHDWMNAYVFVADSPFTVKTDAEGRALLRGAPAGAARLKVWHPYAKGPALESSVQVGAAAQTETVTLDVRRPPERRHSY